MGAYANWDGWKSFSAFAIKRLRNDDRAGLFASNLNADDRVDCGEIGRHISQANSNTEGGALCAAGHLADAFRFFARAPYRIKRTRRRRSFGHFKGSEFLGRTRGFLLRQNGASRKVALLQCHEES